MRNEEISYNTKKNMSQALKSLMEKKDLAKITISDITKLAGYNRKTFYYHFENIDGLLLWTLEEEAIHPLRNYDNKNDYKHAILFIMDYIENNQTILNCAYNSVGRESLRKLFYKDFFKMSGLIVDKLLHEKKQKVDASFKDFLCKMFAGAIATIIIDYFSKNEEDYKNIDREKMANYIMLITSTSLKTSIEAYAKTYN